MVDNKRDTTIYLKKVFINYLGDLKMFKKLLLVFPLVISINAISQDSDTASDVEEVVTV